MDAHRLGSDHFYMKQRLQMVIIASLTAGLAGCGDDINQVCVAPGAAAELATDDALAALEGLEFDAFLEDSYVQLLRRSPETIAIYGLSDQLGTRNDQLDDASDAFANRTWDLVDGTLAHLRSYDRQALSIEQQVSYDVYEWYLTDWSSEREFLYYDYANIIGVYAQTYWALVLYHPIDNLDDARDYIARLRQVSRKAAQVRQALAAREAQGIVAPGFLLQPRLDNVRFVAQTPALELPFYTSFASRLADAQGIDSDDRRALLGDAEAAIECHVIPAFQDLERDFQALMAAAPEDVGAGQYPEGEAFYARLLAHYTTTDMTADEIHQLGLDELEILHGQMRQRFAELGYPDDEPLPTTYGRVAEDSGYVMGSAAIAEYEAIIADAESRMDEVFNEVPGAELVILDSNGDYYVVPALDGSRPGEFHAYVDFNVPRFTMPTLAYHEAIPGHHFQLSQAQKLDLPSFRADPPITAYTEGWGLYAENLASFLDWYENDPRGELGFLQAQAFRAARLVVDTGLHHKGWSFTEATQFMVDNVALADWEAEGQIARYIRIPGQATAYWIGMRKILDLRQKAMTDLGPDFDLKEFHSAVLQNSALPLDVLETTIEQYITESTQPAATAAVAADPATPPIPRPLRDAILRARQERHISGCSRKGLVPDCLPEIPLRPHRGLH